MDSFLHSCEGGHQLMMSSADAFTDSKFPMELGQTMFLPSNGLAPVIPSQMGADFCYAPSLAHYGPTARASVQQMGHLSSEGNVLLDSNNSGALSSGLGAPFPPILHAQLFPEDMAYVQDTGFDYCNQSVSATYRQAAFLPQTINPCLMPNNFNTVPVIPESMADLPRNTLTESLPAPIQDYPASSSTGDAWRFLGVRSRGQHECLWADGSGKVCGYLATLRGVKQHIRAAHELHEYGLTIEILESLDDQLTSVHRKAFCSLCTKYFASSYGFKLHMNKQ